MSQVGRGGRELPQTGSRQESMHSSGPYAVAMASQFRLLPTEQEVWAWTISLSINCGVLRRYGCLSDLQVPG